jgi:hypothetical protein
MDYSDLFESPRDEIGRHAILRGLWTTSVPVRIRPWALYI